MPEQKQGSQAVTKIRQLFRERGTPLTLNEINTALPELKASQISMTMCYLGRQKYAIRKQIDNPNSKERKKVWQYTYSDKRFMEVPKYED